MSARPARKRTVSGEPPAGVGAQLATLVSDVPPGDDWVHEIKYDGYRLLCRLSSEGVQLITRNGNDWTSRFPRIAAAAAGLPCDNALLDGEAVVLNARGVSDFQALQNAIHRQTAEPIYFVFDLLFLDGRDLRSQPLLERKRQLARLVGGGDVIRYSDHVQGHGDVFFEQACRAGLEGIISKRADGSHHTGRGRDWLKIKCLKRQEFVITGYTEPSGSRKGLGALLLGVHDADGRLVDAGKVGTGFTADTLRELHERLQPRQRKTAPIADPPRSARGVHWVEPAYVAEVAFTEWTRDGRIRHPSFRGLREDKPAREVVREQPGTVQRGRAVTRARSVRKSGARTAGTEIAGIRITSPDRVLYPEQGVTKIELARYWESVAERALRYLLDRPLTLLRCPTGRHKQCFYQKHWSRGMPKTVPRVTIEERDGPEPYMYIDGLPSLIALVQFGVLEFHVWNARRDRIDQPDQLVFDLDPGTGLTWAAVVEAAVLVRAQLAAVGLTSFVKWSGGKGLHVVVPLMRRGSWDDAREFARALAESVANAEPARYTAVMAKRERTNRIFIDYLRNGYNATAVAAWSPRARAGAPVSIPLAWEQLNPDGPPDTTIRNAPDLLADSDPWQDMGAVRQSITADMRKAVGLR